MNHWAFVWTAYGLTALGTAAVSLSSWCAMRRAEARAQQMGGRE